MIQNNQTPPMKPEQTIVMMQILCGAMAAAVAMLTVVLFITRKPVYDAILFSENIRNPIHAVLFFLGVVVLLLRIPLANSVLANALEKYKPQGIAQILPVYFTPFILRVALAEAAATLGFVSTHISGEVSTFIMLGAAAFVAIIKEFPSLEKVKERVRAVSPNIQF